MSQAQAATGLDRLPWLPDEPQTEPPAKRRAGSYREAVVWGVIAMLAVAALAYWLGQRSWQTPAPQRAPAPAQSTTTTPVPRPQAEPQPQQPQVILEPAPQVSPVPVRQVPIARPRAERRSVIKPSHLPRRGNETAALEEVVADQKAASETATAAAPPKAQEKPLKAWPASQSEGAKGRIVRIGAFGSRQQAKLGWRYMVRAYPAVAHLKATVVADHNSHGRRFYRFQIGTTSQAHSEVLCQRMRIIGQSCVVIGLPPAKTQA